VRPRRQSDFDDFEAEERAMKYALGFRTFGLPPGEWRVF
jgi:hypothetical protein